MTQKQQVKRMSKAELAEAVEIAEELRTRQARKKWLTFYPPGGVLGRNKYPKHLASFYAGKKYRQRCVCAANRVGKSEGIGAYEASLHLTGEYPDWWPGRKFNRAVSMWCAGDTGKTVRDILQKKLLGPFGNFGTGMIPGAAIEGTSPKHGLPEAVEIIRVKHVSGASSICTLKSYDQRREAFQGTEQDFIWLDEEPDADIYGECLMRIMTTQGSLLLTFTPLKGVSEVVKSFMPHLGEPDRKVLDVNERMSNGRV